MNEKQPNATIGSLEVVDFPRLGVKNIPAKVDTGADSSSIWVSDIRLTDEGLSFVLFAPGSPFYTGNEITVGTYETAKVKNTSGVTEFRYKVRLVVRLQDRNIRAWFTLSNRSGMTYPILLGRRFLKNRFVVDVSKTSLSKNPKKSKKQILILIAKPNNIKDLNEFYQQLFGKKAKVVVAGYTDLVFWISPGRVVIKETITNQNLATFDLVYFKSHQKQRELAGALAHYLHHNHIKLIDTELRSSVAYDKLSTYVRLAVQGISIPRSFYASIDNIQKDLNELFEKFGTPLVIKEINSDRGKKNYLIRNKKDLASVISKSAPGDIYVVQQYIENDGYIRVCIFGRTAWPMVYRHAVENPDPLKRHLNQPAGSANAVLLDEKYPDRRQIQDLALRASGIMNRQIAGVDIVQDKKTGERFVLEVNLGPQLKSGSFTDEKLETLVKFIDIELNQ